VQVNLDVPGGLPTLDDGARCLQERCPNGDTIGPGLILSFSPLPSSGTNSGPPQCSSCWPSGPGHRVCVNKLHDVEDGWDHLLFSGGIDLAFNRPSQPLLQPLNGWFLSFWPTKCSSWFVYNMILPRTDSLFSKTSFIIAWLVNTLSSFALMTAAMASSGRTA